MFVILNYLPYIIFGYFLFFFIINEYWLLLIILSLVIIDYSIIYYYWLSYYRLFLIFNKIATNVNVTIGYIGGYLSKIRFLCITTSSIFFPSFHPSFYPFKHFLVFFPSQSWQHWSPLLTAMWPSWISNVTRFLLQWMSHWYSYQSPLQYSPSWNQHQCW